MKPRLFVRFPIFVKYKMRQSKWKWNWPSLWNETEVHSCLSINEQLTDYEEMLRVSLKDSRDLALWNFSGINGNAEFVAYLPIFVFSLADVTYQAPMLFSLQNLAICSLGTTGQGISHLFAKRTTGISEPSGNVTFSRRSLNHFLIDWNVAIREISNTKAAATLKIKRKIIAVLSYDFIGLKIARIA